MGWQLVSHYLCVFPSIRPSCVHVESCLGHNLYTVFILIDAPGRVAFYKGGAQIRSRNCQLFNKKKIVKIDQKLAKI